MNPRRLSAYEVFLLLVHQGCTEGEIRRGHPGKSVNALWRLYVPEVMGGNTGYMNGVQPDVAAYEYLTYIYDGGPMPYWVQSAGL